MDAKRIIALLHTPSLLKEVKIEELQDIIEVYPFFSATRLLLTKKMQLSQHLLLKKEIKKTAVSVTNRKAMYEFLYQKDIRETIKDAQPEVETSISISAPIPIPETKKTASETKLSTTLNKENATIQKDPKEAETSSFTKDVVMEPAKKSNSSFSMPIDLKRFGKEDSKEMDFLEKQIIGQTIEHVLSQEIAASKKIIPKRDAPPAPRNNDSQKFSEWLTILDQDRLKDWRNQKERPKQPNEMSIIDSFLQKDIKIISSKNDDIEYTPSNLARLSIVDDGDFVTQTLADIYYKQGNIQKALNAYKKLLLKYPEKKTYFAARIEKLEKELK